MQTFHEFNRRISRAVEWGFSSVDGSKIQANNSKDNNFTKNKLDDRIQWLNCYEYAHDNDCNYIGINFPMDYCVNCGYMGRMLDRCPSCQSNAVKRLRRVSGYLVEDTSFTQGKKKELKARTVHL